MSHETNSLPAPLVPAELTPREGAAVRGLNRYVDGRPCIHGHVGERYTRNASCVECQRIVNQRDKRRFRRLMEAGRNA